MGISVVIINSVGSKKASLSVSSYTNNKIKIKWDTYLSINYSYLWNEKSSHQIAKVLVLDPS